MMTEDPLRPVVLLRVPSELEGNMVLNLLSDTQIKATLTGSFTSGFQAEAPGEVCVMVRSEDLERAKKVVQVSATRIAPKADSRSKVVQTTDLLLLFSVVLMLAISGLWIVFF